MTDRFKKAVNAYVVDGVLTEEEKQQLHKIAKDDKIDETEAEVYIIQELKKRRCEIDKEKGNNGFWHKVEKIAGPLATIVVVALPLIFGGNKK